MASTRGLLLINLGTPDAPDTRSVRRYLREFLSDPRVLDISPLGRWLLLNLVILPFRPSKSAAAYRKVWTERGSPLMVHSQDLQQAVAEQLKGQFEVAFAMRYGNPSLPEALKSLRERGITELTVVPLYPQYASSSTGSSLERVYQLVSELWNVLPLRVVGPFFNQPEYLDAFAKVARGVLDESRSEHVMFSFHGLPERQISKSDPTGAHCFASASCCDSIVPANAFCYRAQSFHTARSLAQRLALPPERFTVGFQSRLGRTPWIKPYSDVLIPQLAKRGIKRLAVMCPAFVADCLETVEEIGIRAKESFLAAGGEDLVLIPSLNADPLWVDGIVRWVREPQPRAELRPLAAV